MTKVRVRFAPSPTGGLHIGGVRTALYNYLFAKNRGGKFILRIEDTDRNRFVEGAEKYISNALTWCGIEADESPEKGGPFGPYRQSERKHIYKEYIDQMVASGKAYLAFDSPEELGAMREQLSSQKASSQAYSLFNRLNMRNSLSMPAAEVEELRSTSPYVVRLKVEPNQEVLVTDKVRGEVIVNSNSIDDKVLFKADGMPTYHLANVVDDHIMEITHVIRGEEWLPSAPVHVLIYQAFGWTPPEFAHLPLLLKPEGNGKLSKRDADKHGFPIFPISWKAPENKDAAIGFREQGYLPKAFVNFLAFLGWNPGTDQEIMSETDLVNSFTLARVGKSGAKFDISKANWFNEQYIKNMAPEAILDSIREDFPKSNNSDLLRIISLFKERVTFLHEIVDQSIFFFEQPESYDEKAVRKKWNEENAAALKSIAIALVSHKSLTREQANETIQAKLELLEIGMGKIMQPLRVAITGLAGGPDLMEIISIMGPQLSAERINRAISRLAKKETE